MKTIIATILITATSVFAGTYRVTYSYNGLIKRITVSAESTQDVRNTVKDLFPTCYVTGAQKVGK